MASNYESIDCFALSKLINNPNEMEKIVIIDVRAPCQHRENRIKYSFQIGSKYEIFQTIRRLQTKALDFTDFIDYDEKKKNQIKNEFSNQEMMKNIERVKIVLYDDNSLSEIKYGQTIQVAFDKLNETLENVDCKILLGIINY